MKPRLLDLFCGAGGATRGYQLAGFPPAYSEHIGRQLMAAITAKAA